MTMREVFRRFAHRAAEAVGSPWAFMLAIVVVLGWVATGPLFRYSDTWQLVINTGTTIITFLVVFLVQNMQNRDAKAIQLKLDELIRSVHGARTRMVHLEDWTDEQLVELEREFSRLRARLDRKPPPLPGTERSA